MIEITGALQGARALAQAAKLALEARDEAKIKEAVLALQEKLADAISAALATVEKSASLQAQLLALQREKAELEQKLLDRSKYRLQEIKPGRLAYVSEPVDEGDKEPKHYLCQPCRDQGVKSILRYGKSTGYDAPGWFCLENFKHAIYD